LAARSSAGSRAIPRNDLAITTTIMAGTCDNHGVECDGPSHSHDDGDRSRDDDDSMAGYSSTPTAKKLGISPGSRLLMVNAPDGWEVPGLPDQMTVERAAAPPTTANPRPDVVIAFFRAAAQLHDQVESLSALIFPSASLWIAWPRRAAGHKSDLTDNIVRGAILPLGLVDIKIAAIDENWSGQRVVWRKERRSAP
jgi:hypothetical protein